MHQCAISHNMYPKEIENWIPENIRQNISTVKNKIKKEKLNDLAHKHTITIKKNMLRFNIQSGLISPKINMSFFMLLSFCERGLFIL